MRLIILAKPQNRLEETGKDKSGTMDMLSKATSTLCNQQRGRRYLKLLFQDLSKSKDTYINAFSSE